MRLGNWWKQSIRSTLGDVLSLHEQGGMVVRATAEKPNLPLIAANDPNIVRWYQEDQVLNIVLSEPMQINQVSEITLRAGGELRDVLGGNERIVAVVIQRPYMRQVHVPSHETKNRC